MYNEHSILVLVAVCHEIFKKIKLLTNYCLSNSLKDFHSDFVLSFVLFPVKTPFGIPHQGNRSLLREKHLIETYLDTLSRLVTSDYLSLNTVELKCL